MKTKAKRPKAVLRLKIDGRHIKPGRIPIPELLEILTKAQEAVNRQAEVLRGRPGVRPGPMPTVVKEACTLELFAIGRGSAVISFSRPDPEPKSQEVLDIEIEDLGQAAVRTIVDSLKSAGSKSRSKKAVELDPGVKQSLLDMGKLFSNGVGRVDWIAPSQSGSKRPTTARFDESVLERLSVSAKGRARNEITIDGRLEMADFKIDDLKCLLRIHGGQRVLCTFTKDREEDVFGALRGVVRVTGLATYARPSDRLEKIELYSVKRLDRFLADEGDAFFQGLSLAELTKAQGVDPTFDLRTLPNAWPEDEDVETFLEAIGER